MYLSKTEAAALRSRRRIWPLLGPAVAYLDPGNVATNFSGGAAFGYTLLWVIVAANLMGSWVNRRVTTAVGVVVAVLIIGLNLHLLAKLAL